MYYSAMIKKDNALVEKNEKKKGKGNQFTKSLEFGLSKGN